MLSAPLTCLNSSVLTSLRAQPQEHSHAEPQSMLKPCAVTPFAEVFRLMLAWAGSTAATGVPRAARGSAAHAVLAGASPAALLPGAFLTHTCNM